MRVTRSFPFKGTLYIAFLISMVFSATQLYVPKTTAFGVCCTFSSQCTDPGHTLCFAPPPFGGDV
jgi:hypothetical protein